MWFNSTQREEPYLGLNASDNPRDRAFWVKPDRVQGAAWLSSARVVRCWVKSRNERNPYQLLPAGNAGNSVETAVDKTEEGGDDVKSSRPLCPGLHTCYNGIYKGQQHGNMKQIPKSSPQFRLKSATRLH